jgi:hypothetical protein
MLAGATLGASTLCLAPGAALAADFVYWGDSSYSQAFGAGRLFTEAVSTEMSRFTESADGSARRITVSRRASTRRSTPVCASASPCRAGSQP